MPRFTYLDSFLGPMGRYEGVRNVYDDTFLDRLAHYYTVIILCFYCMFAVTEDYFVRPIYCWMPEEFELSNMEYALKLCWVANTYYVPFSKPIPPQFEPRRTQEIAYYQWVPLIMLLMAFCFKFPRHLWKYMAQRSGIEVKKMLELAYEAADLPPEERVRQLRHIAIYIDSWCSGVNSYRGGICSIFRERYNETFSFGFGRHYGNYLVTLALAIKFSYFFNALVQLFFLNEFLGGGDFYVYGYEVLYNVFFRGVWGGTRRFPSVTICDFDLRQIENVQRFSLQCLLPINIFNEKFFVFLWFWISIVVIASLINFFYALSLTVFTEHKYTFARKYLLMNFPYDKENYHTNKLIRKFTENHLRQDGIFLLKLFSKNTSCCADIIVQLWEIYLKRIYRARVHRHKAAVKKGLVVRLPEPSVYESCV